MFPLPRTTLLLILALVLALAATGYNYQRGEKFRERAEAAETRTVELVNALQVQNEVAQKCAEANKKLFVLNAQQSRDIEAQAKVVRESAQQLASARAALRAKEDADREIPACETLLRSDLGVCPGHTSGVRNRAARSLQRSGGGSAPSGANADRPSSDS